MISTQLDDDLALLAAELVAREDEMVALYRITEALRRQLEIAPGMRAMLRPVQEIFTARIAFVVLYDRLQLFQTGKHREGDLLRFAERVRDQTSDLLLTNRLPDGIERVLIAPLTVEDETVGAVGVIDKPTPFQSADRKLLGMITSLVSGHIENIKLHEQQLAQVRIQSEMNLARQVQVRLLPREMPTVEAADIYGTTEPALMVGGDFYDAVPLDDGTMVVVVGDVSGKGMSAAMLMGMVRTTVRNSIEFAPDSDPAGWMAQVNAAMYDDFTEVEMLTTLFLAQFDPATKQVKYANAGHSPVVYCTDDEPLLLEADGTALGILPTCFCECHTLDLKPDDVLVMGTDGIVEGRNGAGEMVGYERLATLVKVGRFESAAALANLIIGDVKQFTQGQPQEDDQTLVVLKGMRKCR